MSFTKFTLRSELFFGPKVLLQESRFFQKKNLTEIRSPKKNELYDISKSKGSSIQNFEKKRNKRGTAVPFLVRAFTPPGLSSKKLGSTDLQRAHVIGGQTKEGKMEVPHRLNLDSFHGMLGSLPWDVGIPHHPMFFCCFFFEDASLCVFWHRRNSCPFFFGGGGRMGGGFSASTSCQFLLRMKILMFSKRPWMAIVS